MANDNAVLLEEYAENKKRIAALRSALDKAGDQMSVLGEQLKRDPRRVIAAQGEFSITDEFYASNAGRVVAIEYHTISAESIERSLTELKSCLDKEQKLGERLSQAGLEREA